MEKGDSGGKGVYISPAKHGESMIHIHIWGRKTGAATAPAATPAATVQATAPVAEGVDMNSVEYAEKIEKIHNAIRDVVAKYFTPKYYTPEIWEEVEKLDERDEQYLYEIVAIDDFAFAMPIAKISNGLVYFSEDEYTIREVTSLMCIHHFD